MSSSESSSDSESEEQPKTIVQAVVTKNKDDSDSGSDSDSDSSSEEKPVVKATPVKEESDSDSDSDSSEEEEKKTKPVKKVAVPAAAEDSDSDSDSDSSEEEEQKTTQVKKVATPAQEEDDSSDSDSDSEEEQEKKTAKAKKKPTPVAAVKKEESDDSDSSSDEEEEATKQATENPPAEDDDSDSSSDEEDQPAKKKPVETEEVEEKETEEDLYKSTIQKDVKMASLFNWNLTEIKAAKGKKRKLENAKTPQVSKKLKAESAPAESAPASNKDFTITKEFNEYDFKNAHLKDISKCVFVKGISTNAYEKDIYEFFTDIEKPLDVRHRYFEDRAGIAFVNFSSAAAASKAVIDKNNEYIKDRWINTDWAEEKKKMSSNRGPKNIHMKDQTNRVWMGNLHREVTEDGVVELFKEIGELTDVFIIGRDESRPKIAYVSFNTNEEATKAVEALQGTSFLDNTLRLDWAEPRRDNSGGDGGRPRKRRNESLSEKEEGTVTVFVGRLSDQATEETLTEHFKDSGEISQIRWVEKDGEFKGVAFVEFAHTDMTDEAVKLNGSTYAGREIRVDYAKNNKRRKQEW